LLKRKKLLKRLTRKCEVKIAKEIKHIFLRRKKNSEIITIRIRYTYHQDAAFHLLNIYTVLNLCDYYKNERDIKKMLKKILNNQKFLLETGPKCTNKS
jgi:hypothetical protein